MSAVPMVAFNMRIRRPVRGRGIRARFRWGVWLGLLALALNALVPVHVAIDVAEALVPYSPRAAATEWHLLALLTGHVDNPSKSGGHHKGHATDCAVCNSLGTLAAAAPGVVPPLLPVPVAAGEAVIVSASTAEPVQASDTGYRSRAPPIS